eukprot:1146936-Amorphochlora_amoeboformis.AAC.2
MNYRRRNNAARNTGFSVGGQKYSNSITRQMYDRRREAEREEGLIAQDAQRRHKEHQRLAANLKSDDRYC